MGISAAVAGCGCSSAPSAGGVAVNFGVDEFARTLRSLEERGFDASAATTLPTGVELLALDDPDGNVVTVIGNLATG